MATQIQNGGLTFKRKNFVNHIGTTFLLFFCFWNKFIFLIQKQEKKIQVGEKKNRERDIQKQPILNIKR